MPTTRTTVLGMGSVTGIVKGSATVAGGSSYLTKAGNLGDVIDAAEARVNIGLEIGVNVQAYDADLAAIAALGSTGMVARTGAGAAAVRTITGTSNQVSVSNGDGVSGNPTLSLPQNIHTGASPAFAGLTLSAPLSPGNGGTGQAWGSSSGIPLLTSGTASLLSSTGSGDVARASGATLTGAALNGTLGASTPSTISATTGVFSSTVTLSNNAGYRQNDNGGTARTLLNLDASNNCTLNGGAGGILHLNTSSSTEQVRITHTASSSRAVTMTGSNGGNPALGVTAGGLNLTAGTVYASGVGTTASAANAYLDNGSSPANSLLRSTSSLAFKRVLGDLGIDEARKVVFGSKAIRYQSRAVADNPLREFVGFGAEQIAAVDDRFVTRRSDASPDWVQYPAFVAPLCVVSSDLHERLRRVEQHLALI